jgi:hypothetical protein
MLGTLLDRLGGLFSKHFLIGAFFPVLLAAGANGFLLFATCQWARDAVADVEKLGAGRQGIVIFAALIVLAAGAYLFSASSPLLRELLEGRHWPAPLSAACERWQRARRRRADVCIERARRGRRQIRLAAPGWQKALEEARSRGLAKGKASQDGVRRVETSLSTSWSQVEGSGLVSSASLGAAVSTVAALLEGGNADLSDELDALDARVAAVLREAQIAWDLEYRRAFVARRSDFGDGRVAATSLGNVAETVQTHGVGCYGLDVDTFWVSLEQVLAKDVPFHESIQDARTELNFFVSLWWLTATSVLAWWIFGAVLLSWQAFVAAALLGPSLAILWYGLALRSYRNLSARLKSALDVHRFDLLTALHVALPEGLQGERDIWKRLTRLAGFGEDVELTYEHPTGS